MISREDKIKLIDKINKRIRRAETKFGFDEETKKLWREQLSDIVQNTDLLTKTGLLSTSKKALDQIDENEFKVLENNLPSSIKELEQNARESLEESGVSKTIGITTKDISQEVGATIRVTSSFKGAVEAWYELRDTMDPIYLSNENVKELDAELYSKGQKSYSELEGWMSRLEQVMNIVSRRG